MFYSNAAWILGLLLTVSACGGANIEYVYVTAETGGDSTARETEAPIPSTDGGVSTDAQASSSTSSATVVTNVDAETDAQVPTDGGLLTTDANPSDTAASTDATTPCAVSVPMACTFTQCDYFLAYPAGCVIPLPQVCGDNQTLACEMVYSETDTGRVPYEYCTQFTVFERDSQGVVRAGRCMVLDTIPTGTACGAEGNIFQRSDSDSGVITTVFSPRPPH
jgi:hypothetical protein